MAAIDTKQTTTIKVEDNESIHMIMPDGTQVDVDLMSGNEYSLYVLTSREHHSNIHFSERLSVITECRGDFVKRGEDEAA